MSSHAAHRVDCFSVFSAADPSTLPRILEVFSVFGLIPDRCHSSCMETDRSQLVIDVQIAGLPLGQADQLAKRLSRVVTVTQVLCSEKHLAAA